MSKLSRRGVVLIVAVALIAIAGAGTVLADPGGVFGQSDNPWPYNSAGHGSKASPVLVAVGDIACEPDNDENHNNPAAVKCGGSGIGGQTAEYATAEQAYSMRPNLVAILGDEQYQVGKLSDFDQSYEQTWGGLKMLERPSPGNHEYYAYTKKGDNEKAQNGNGYFAYFNGHDAAGTPNAEGQAGDDTSTNQGWYSYNLGNWHIISLNIECNSDAFNNDCSTTDGGVLSEETSWLAQDLKQNNRPCTLAYWHQPTFSSTVSPFKTDSQEGMTADAWWQLLYQHHATLILNGHDHVYSRFAPMDPDGNADPKHGIREFIVGTGGESLDTVLPDTPNLQDWADQYYGVMKLTLKPDGYDWDYESAMPASPTVTPSSFSDTGSARCNNA
ncbi:MAG TPA: metallophosphoesterase [Gaiellaceae bacterium]|nr:metallophosphoesterase [Gaiellaceae bacterium]